MTLVLSVHNRKTTWMLTDRRLSAGSRVVRDDAMKTMILETHDGVAILGYAGLGATARGTEPSEWMSATLRGMDGLTLEQALQALTDAAARELPRHLTLSAAGHVILATGFVRGKGAKLYGIHVEGGPSGRRYIFTSYQRTTDLWSDCPRIAMAGSGAYSLERKRGRWQRELFNILKAHDKGRVSDRFVANHLARLNYEVHREEASVGPRCIVVTKRNSELAPMMSGGGSDYYIGRVREADSRLIPCISNGMDVTQLVALSLEAMKTKLEGPISESGFLPKTDRDEMNRKIEKLPWDSDPRLR